LPTRELVLHSRSRAQLLPYADMTPILIATAPIAAFLLAFALGLVAMPPKARAALLLAGLLGAGLAFVFADPQGNCDYDCETRAGAELLTALGIASWLIGFGVTALIRRSIQRP
jgi:hypothetical protein